MTMAKLPREVCRYATCPNGHKVYVIWSDSRQAFGFTCDECREHSLIAITAHGLICIEVVASVKQ